MRPQAAEAFRDWRYQIAATPGWVATSHLRGRFRYPAASQCERARSGVKALPPRPRRSRACRLTNGAADTILFPRVLYRLPVRTCPVGSDWATISRSSGAGDGRARVAGRAQAVRSKDRFPAMEVPLASLPSTGRPFRPAPVRMSGPSVRPTGVRQIQVAWQRTLRGQGIGASNDRWGWYRHRKRYTDPLIEAADSSSPTGGRLYECLPERGSIDKAVDPGPGRIQSNFALVAPIRESYQPGNR